MTKALAALSLILSLPAFAQIPDGTHFKRFEFLSKKFPEVFKGYVQRKFIVPTERAEFDERSVDSLLSISPRLTWLGKINKIEPMITAWYNRPEERHIILSNMEMSLAMPPDYGWKVMIAEILHKYRQTRKVELVLTSIDGALFTATCADRLAQGRSLISAIEATPAHRALSAYGFNLITQEVGAGNDRTDEANWLGELEVRATYWK